MGEVVSFMGVTRLDINADDALNGAVGKLNNAVVLGFNKEGDFYFASSMADGGDVMWLLEVLKLKFLTVYVE